MPMRSIFLDLLDGSDISEQKIDLDKYGQDWLKLTEPKPSLVLFPRSTEQVAAIVKRASEKRISIVPSGGRTGLSGGASAAHGEVVVSLEKMRTIHSISTTEMRADVQAGVITQTLQEEVKKKGLFFPVDFASKGSSMLGGNAATNAGGIRVIRYGLFRDWVLGLKAVTGTGEIIDTKGSLVKNQTGYDFRHLLIGSEGTLAIITELSLKLTKPPKHIQRMLCGLSTLEKVIPLLDKIRSYDLTLAAFEFFMRNALEKVMTVHGFAEPLEQKHAAYVVIEFEDISEEKRSYFDACCMELLEQGFVDDAVISQNSKQADELMAYRERISETLSTLAVLHKNDISVPVASVPAFSKELIFLIQKNYPHYEVVLFGHIGDGNIHVNILKPEHEAVSTFRAACHSVDEATFSLVARYGGSISAEHGVGLLKREFLPYTRSAHEIALMKEIKRAFDPQGILNPGKLLR